MEYREAAVIGDVCERRVSDALRREAARLGYAVVEGLLFIDDRTTAQIDHLVIDRFGILVIETKNYSALIKGRSQDPRWTACYRGAPRRREGFLNPLRQNDRHREMIHRLLQARGRAIPPEYVQSLVVFAGGNIEELRLDDVDTMRVIREWELLDYLEARCGDFPPNPGALDREQVAEFVSMLASMNQSGDPEIARLHADNVAAATQRWRSSRRTKTADSGARPARTPYALGSVFRPQDRYPDGSQSSTRFRRGRSRWARQLFGFGAMIGLGWWLFFAGGFALAQQSLTSAMTAAIVSSMPKPTAATAVIPPVVPSQPALTYNVPLALSRLQEASPGICARLGDPQRPALGVTSGLPTYTWQYLTQRAGNQVSAQTISITLDGSGQIVGVTGGR